jgi:hypothetical protein
VDPIAFAQPFAIAHADGQCAVPYWDADGYLYARAPGHLATRGFLEADESRVPEAE